MVDEATPPIFVTARRMPIGVRSYLREIRTGLSLPRWRRSSGNVARPPAGRVIGTLGFVATSTAERRFGRAASTCWSSSRKGVGIPRQSALRLQTLADAVETPLAENIAWVITDACFPRG